MPPDLYFLSGSSSNIQNRPGPGDFGQSPQKVGFAFKGKSRFQPRQNALRAPPPPEVQRAHDIAESIKGKYETEEFPSFQPQGRGRGRGNQRRAMFKPGDEEPSERPHNFAGRIGAPSRFNNNNNNTNNNNIQRPGEVQEAPSPVTPGRGRGRGRGGKGRGRGRGQKQKNDNNSNNQECTAIGNTSFDTVEKKDSRANRFKRENAITVNDTISMMMKSATKAGGEDHHFSDVHLIGTMTDLEKPYLRLTSAPAPDQVRPEQILVKSLAHVLGRWKREQNYVFVCEQLKSIRQDCTIQNIKNGFAVKVYECHARIAMEKLDTTEYNQCQTRLMDLYEENAGAGNPHEFISYRILYYIYINNPSAATKAIASLTPKQSASDDIQFAAKVFRAWSSGNYLQFFRAYLDAPKMSGYLMDIYVQRERNIALRKLVRAYKPNVSVKKVTEMLGYPDYETTVVYLDDLSTVVFTNDNKTVIDCKKTTIDL